MENLASSNPLNIDSTIYIFRHGARFDLANPDWKNKVAKVNGGLVNDSPLSDIGHKQAREAVVKLECTKADAILVSPYLRTIQTAVPFSDQTGLSICLEHGLSEGPHVPNILPDAGQRYLYFPQINTDYASMIMPIASNEDINISMNKAQESFPHGYFRRIVKFANALENKFFGKTVLCFSHAASVALVAALLKCNIEDIPADKNCKNDLRTDLFAPLGMYKLTRRGYGDWTLACNGSTNKHLVHNDPTTYPWGHNEYCRQIWKKVICDTTNRSN